jgi:hypothetical protein
MAGIPNNAADHSKTKVVRLTGWAYSRLIAAHADLEREVKQFPERYPAHAGRRLTLSDVVVLALEGKGSTQ